MGVPSKTLLERTCALASAYFDRLPDRRVGSGAEYAELVEALGGPLPDGPDDPLAVIERLVAKADPGVVASAGPRYFGFVIGGSLPAALAADWIASAWDQNAFTWVTSPAATVVEEITRGWLCELLGLSSETSVGFVTGATMANFTCLAAARHALLNQVGWNVEEQGLFGAPELTVFTSDESHASLFAALQMVGLGRKRVTRIAADGQGRMRAEALQDALSRVSTPVLVCAQAGHVNTGGIDPLAEIAAAVRRAGGWLHVDGAFGAWAAASPRLRAMAEGLARADSIAVDAHKWLNVPYDSGLAFVRDRDAHQSAMSLEAPYYVAAPNSVRMNHHWVPETSRRARGFAIYAALRSLGRQGVAELIDRCCRLAQRMAERLSADPRVRVVNDVVLNQVLVRLEPPSGADADAFTAEVIRKVQEDGTCWLGGTTWRGRQLMRISVSNWSTTEADIDRSAEAILRCL